MDAPLSAGRGKTEPSERKPRGGGGGPRGGARSGGGGSGPRGGGRGGRPQVCYNCGQEGHISAECPNPKVEGGVKKCYNCGELGHISADCPQPRQEREPRAPRNGDRKGYSEHDDRGGKTNRKEDRACRICGKIGHLARDCRSAGAKTDKTCRICGKVGHLARDCRSKGAQKGGKGQKRGRGGPRSASDLDREMDMYHGKPGKKAKPTADELDAEMDAYNKAAATGAVAAEA